MINKVILVGNVGAKPDVTNSQNVKIASVSLATSERYTDKSGEKQTRTEWHRVKFFGKMADVVEQYVDKGKTIYVEGRISSSKYTDKEGVDRVSYDIIASGIKIIGGKNDAPSTAGSSQQKSQVLQSENINPVEDLPF